MNNIFKESKKLLFFMYMQMAFSLVNMYFTGSILGAGSRGIIQYIFSMQMMIAPVLTFGLGYGYTRSYRYKLYYPNIYKLMSFVFSSSLLLIFIYLYFSQDVILDENITLFYVYVTISVLCFYLLDLYRVENSMRTFRNATIIPTIVQTIGFILCFILDVFTLNSALIVIVVAIFIQLTYLLFGLKNIYRDLTAQVNGGSSYFKYSIGISFNLLLMGMSSSIDKVLIAKLFSPHELGRISVLLGFSLVFAKIFDAIATTYFTKGLKGKFKIELNMSDAIKILSVSLLFFPGVYFFAEFFVPIIFGDDYMHLGHFFVLIIATTIVNGMAGIFSQDLMLSEKPYLISIRTLISIAFFTVLVYCLSYIGVFGILISSLLSALLKMILTIVLVKNIDYKPAV
ncbi:lipopolysaccharide biosynthesis protein [Aeromonas veronii]|uniref:lipopolysaccharide biosynthesis protein n=1 Tax=Aeromonas veronii TaxID=654 RepID=UPI003B9F3EEF